MRPDTLATPDEVFAFARIPSSERSEDLVRFVGEAVANWTLQRYGPTWKDDIPANRVGYAALEIKALVTLDVFEPNEHRREILQTQVREAAFTARTTYQLVRHYLRRRLPEALEAQPLEAAKELVQVFRAAKGEFNHYDEIKKRLAVVTQAGATVRILKGNDARLQYVADGLASIRIPCRAWSPTRPAVRYYRVDDSFLLLFSHGQGDYTCFGGEHPNGVKAADDLFELDWQMATPANTITP